MINNKIVILGLGNPLFQDEGVGIHMINRLMQGQMNEAIELVDGGTGGMALLNVVEDTDLLLVIDAVDGDYPPGTVCKLSGRDIPMLVSGRMSAHQISFQETLALAGLRGKLPGQMVLLGVQPQSMDWGTELSPPVAGILSELDAMINEQIGIWLT
ncbi:MAG TPA: HyaD/HybD family hydrogenase maturation endopeptidase [Syntrophomonas sp.]|nr:HyaD/HybD family hydrogenase maturation endopeptidase [Syntrophomonas sp.]